MPTVGDKGVRPSSVATLDAITTKYAGRGKTVEIVGLNERSARMHGAAHPQPLRALRPRASGIGLGGG
ncbi:MAG: hypothetical protein ABIQ18_31410 [Umezawaea sp.]